MLLLGIIRRVLLPLVPLVLFYLLRKVVKKQQLPKRKSHKAGFDPSTGLRASKNRVVNGEIVEEKL